MGLKIVLRLQMKSHNKDTNRADQTGFTQKSTTFATKRNTPSPYKGRNHRQNQTSDPNVAIIKWRQVLIFLKTRFKNLGNHPCACNDISILGMEGIFKFHNFPRPHEPCSSLKIQ